MTWYAVYKGRKPGVYAKWATCHQQVSEYPNCCYKCFSNEEDANASFLESLVKPRFMFITNRRKW
jgi:ribonuclease HI